MEIRNWKAKLKKACIENSTYEDSFDSSLQILAEILARRDSVKEAYEEFGGKAYVTNDDGDLVRNPALATLNDCEKTALPYFRDLGLTPAGLKKIDSDKTQKIVKKDAFDELVDEIIS